MIPVKHSLRNGVRVIIIAFSYVLIQVALWFVFGFIYYKETGNNSITSFLMSELGNDSGLYVKFCFELFMALVNALVGAWLAKTLLQSRGHIQIDDYCVYRKNSGFIFRYWAVLPKGKYLYNVSIQLRLTSDELNRTGVNRLGTYWDSDSFFFCHTENEGSYYSNNLTVKEFGEINNNKPQDKILLRTE